LRKSSRAILIVFALVLICLGMLVIEAQVRILQRAYDNYILDNVNHYLPCEKLPTEAEVTRIVKEHKEVIQKIIELNPGFVGVEVDTTICPGKADLIIWYGSHQDRVAIEGIIGGDTFFGLPYRLQNR